MKNIRAYFQRIRINGKQKRNCFTVFVILCSLLFCTACFSATQRSPLVTGKWDGNTFTNEWSNIMFELPEGFIVMPFDSSMEVPLQMVTDFSIAAEDNSVIFSLTYYNVGSGEVRDDTAEDYFEKTKEQLAGNPNRTRVFSEGYETAVIAGEEYVVMRSEYVDHHNPTEVHYQDGYARRWVNTMVVFMAVHSDETRESVDSFFSSINPLQ